MILLILFYIIIRAAFGSLAESKSRNKVAWIVIAIVTYFLSQLIGGAIWGIINIDKGEEYLNDTNALMVVGIVSSLIGVSIAYAVLYFLPDLNDVSLRNDENILDDNF